MAGRRRTGVEAHGPDRGHLPSQPGARTGLHPASVIATRRQRTGAAQPPWHRVAGAKRLGCPGSLDQPAPSPCLGEVARAPRRADAHPLGTDEQRPNARAHSGGPAVGGGDAGPRGGDRRCRPADRGTRTCLRLQLLRASSSRPSSTPTRCWISTTTRSIVTLRTSSTRIPKLQPASSARSAPGFWATPTGHCG